MGIRWCSYQFLYTTRIYTNILREHIYTFFTDMVNDPCVCMPEFWNISSPFYLHGLTFIPACISNHKPSKVCDEITYPFLNINGATVEV